MSHSCKNILGTNSTAQSVLSSLKVWPHRAEICRYGKTLLQEPPARGNTLPAEAKL